MYYRVNIADGILDIDYRHLIEGIQLSDAAAVVHLRPCEPRPSWVPITQEEFESYRPPAPEPVIVAEPIDEEKAAMAEAIIAHDMEIEQLKAEILTLKGGSV